MRGREGCDKGKRYEVGSGGVGKGTSLWTE